MKIKKLSRKGVGIYIMDIFILYICVYTPKPLNYLIKGEKSLKQLSRLLNL